MIARYTRKAMGQVWAPKNKFQKMLDVEVAVAKVQADLGLIPRAAGVQIAKKGRFEVARIEEIEAETRHDVIAFVTNVAEHVGEYGRYVHFGLTSSDVLDTATSLLVRDAATVLETSLARLEKALLKQIRTHKRTICAGRTHGMHAEPTSFGFKMAGFLAELRRNRGRFQRAVEQMYICKLSGAVGTYSAQGREVETKVAAKLKLTSETIATQVIPRDRHAELMLSLALVGTGLERLAIELRHLQRTEVGEVVEGFKRGQKGSSAMPHKKNPISAENITGVARLLRGYAQAALENVALWHERDISHSSVERVIFPDAFIICDYAVDRMATLVDELQVNVKQMKRNLMLSQGQLFSSHVLLALVEKGMTREEAYAHVQRVSHNLKNGENLQRELARDEEVGEVLNRGQLQKIFSGDEHLKTIDQILKGIK